MKDLKGTKTEKNLQEAFAGESQARNKYTYYASKAKKDGFVQISKIFEETAANEKEHAEIWFKYLHGGKVPSTIENLKEWNFKPFKNSFLLQIVKLRKFTNIRKARLHTTVFIAVEHYGCYVFTFAWKSFQQN